MRGSEVALERPPEVERLVRPHLVVETKQTLCLLGELRGIFDLPLVEVVVFLA
jgi:hypothetical protein